MSSDKYIVPKIHLKQRKENADIYGKNRSENLCEMH